MPSVIKRSTGIYYGVFSYKGKRVWRSTGEKSEAEARRIVDQFAMQYKTWKNISILKFRDMLIETSQGTLKPSTILLYKQIMTKFATHVGDLQLKAVQPYHIELFKARRSKEVSPVKVNLDFRTLKAAFHRAMKFKMIDSNPFLDCQNVIVPEKEPRYLIKEEFNILINHISDERLRWIVIIAVFTMMRAGEIINLKWENIDFDKKFIHLQNRPDFTIKGKRRRSIPLNQNAINVLKRIPRISEYVFSHEKTLKDPQSSISRRFKRCVRRAHLPEEIHFHSLRHTGATWLGQSKVPLPYLQRILGHANITTTLIYAHPTDEYLKEAVQQLDNFIFN